MAGKFYQRLIRRALQSRTQRLSRGQLESPAVVFSPHFDDETLGVGGTIIQKRRCGAEVSLVFMTDGSGSHAHAMSADRLSALRREEAVEAAKVLGVEASHIYFMDYPERALESHLGAAVRQATTIVADLRCSQVFVPAAFEPPLWSTDHRATTQIVYRALQSCGNQATVYEYGVWFWYHWPWVPISGHRDARRVLDLSRRSSFGLSALANFSTGVRIDDVLAQKRLALDKYRSQMTRLVHEQPWPVLGDVGCGAFLEAFFDSHEYLACRLRGDRDVRQW